MDSLPTELIQEIATYLTLDELENFMLTNCRIHDSLKANVMWLKFYRKHFEEYFKIEFENNKFDWGFLYRKYSIQKNWKEGRFEVDTAEGIGKVQAVCTDGDDIIALVQHDIFPYDYQVYIYDKTSNLIQTYQVGSTIYHRAIFNVFCNNGFVFLLSFISIVILTKSPLGAFKNIMFKYSYQYWVSNKQFIIASDTIENVDKMYVLDMNTNKEHIKNIVGTAFGVVNHHFFVKENPVLLKCYELNSFELKFQIKLIHEPTKTVAHEKYLTVLLKKMIYLYDINNGELVRKIECRGNGILNASTCLSGKYYFSNYFANMIHVFDEYGKELSTFNIDAAFRSLQFVYDEFMIKNSCVLSRGYQPNVYRSDVSEVSREGLKTIYRVQSHDTVNAYVNDDKSKIVMLDNKPEKTFTLHILRFDCKF